MVKIKKLLPDVKLTGSPFDIPTRRAVVEDVSDDVNDAPQAVADKPLKLRKVFNDLVRSETDRTKFKRDRIEFYLPDELIPAFRAATFIGGHRAYDADGEKLVTFLKDTLYAALPDFDSNATPDQVNKFIINGKEVDDLTMARPTVERQMAQLTKTIGQDALRNAAEISLKDEFTPTEIRIAVCGSGNTSISRQLVAKIIVIASELK